jgi:hypothetical protein
MPSPPSRLRIALSLALVGCGLLAACSDSGAPTGKGDQVVVDVEASTGEQLPQTTAPDSSYGVYIDANALPSACTTCACDTTSTFCFGGGVDAGTFSGTCNAAGAAIAIGCNALPSACANEPSCPCILSALQGMLPCTYATCSDTNFSVTCE